MLTSELLGWLESSICEAEIDSISAIDPKKVNLQKIYDELNKKLFGGKLGRYPMKWNNKKTASAVTKYNTVIDSSGKKKFTVTLIEVTKFVQHTMSQVYARIAHEMIHVYFLENGVEDNHDSRFQTEMRRINAMNLGFVVEMGRKITDVDIAPKGNNGKGESYGVLVVDDGRGIVVFNKKSFPNTVLDIARKYSIALWMRSHLEWYISDALDLGKYPIARGVSKSFGTYPVDAALLDRIKKGVKIAEVKKGDLDIIIPGYFAGTDLAGYMKKVG